MSAAPMERGGSLSAEEERRLIHRWQAVHDRAALARVVAAQQGMVMCMALRFRHFGILTDDLIQEGNLALIQAAERFDPAKRTRFITYATYWIRARLFQHVLQSGGPVRIGTSRGQRQVFFGFARARHKLERDGERVGTTELARELGVKLADIESMLPRLRARDVSLDARWNDESTLQLAVLEPSPEDLAAALDERCVRKRVLRGGLELLDARELRIISARHLGEERATFADLGREFRVSRERVRQIESRAKAKLKAYAHAKLSS